MPHKQGSAQSGDPYTHGPDVRSKEPTASEQPMGAVGDHGHAWQKGRPDLSWGQVRKDDPDFYGTL